MAEWLRLRWGNVPKPFKQVSGIYADDSGNLKVRNPDGTSSDLGVGGSSTPVSAVIARDSSFDIHDVGNHPVLWDALYDNYQDFNTLTEIPDGLGLSFAFDGSSADITTTEDGVWSFVYNFSLSTDANWRGTFDTRFGAQTLYTPSGAVSLVSHLLAIPTGTTFGPQFSTTGQASADPFIVSGGVYLIATRLG